MIKKEHHINVPIEVQDALNRLTIAGYEAFIVGGAVRDSLLGRVPNDWDIATSATPDVLVGIFPDHIPTGIKHGTITLKSMELPKDIEITTYRKDGAYSDGRRPDTVTFSLDVEDDVLRRDSTINGLLYDGVHVIDYVGGLRDLYNRCIVPIGTASGRIREDSLRMLRYVRQATQLNFELGGANISIIAAHSHLVLNVSDERIREELLKILVSEDAVRGLKLLQETGLLLQILPELQNLVGFQQHSKYHTKDVWGHTLDVVEKVPATVVHRMAALLHDVGKPNTFSQGENGEGHFYEHHTTGSYMARDIMERLKFSKDETAQVCLVVREHMSQRGNPHYSKRSVKRFINRVGQDNLEVLFDVMMADAIAHRPPFFFGVEKIVLLRKMCYEAIEAGEPMKVTDLMLNGEHLIKMGFPPGPIFKEILNHLLELVMDNPSSNNLPELVLAVRTYELQLQQEAA